MELNESLILRLTIRKLFPAVIIFAIYLFSYGPNFPGGGFQSGVIFGTIVVIFELGFKKLCLQEYSLQVIELLGYSIFLFSLVLGFLLTGYYFMGYHFWQPDFLLLSNLFIWLLNLAIFFEVSGSLVMLFRHFFMID